MDPWKSNTSNYRPPPGFPSASGPRPGQGQYGQPSGNPSFPTPGSGGPFNEFGAAYPPPPGPPPGYNPPQGPPAFPSSSYPSQTPQSYPGQTPQSYPGQTPQYGSPGMAPPMGRAPGPPMVSPNRPGGPPGPPHGHPPPGPQQQPFFQYSRCTGKKKALCIGINYFGQREALRGCINDARNVERFLCERHGYRREDIVVLTDDQQDPRSIPTKNNMLMAMSWLVAGAQPNDSLFFHFSGHGGQAKDTGGDEADGYDEVIYPADFKKAGNIVDDQMHDIMVKPLPAGCRLTSIFDCCHSGSALDLPYVYSTEGKIKEPNLALEAGQGLMGAVSSYSRGDMGGVLRNVTGFVRTATSGRSAQEKTRQTKTSPADVISWSGCKDTQTSADAVEGGEATGAMSYAFILALTQQPQQSYQQLLVNIRNILRAKYSQKPQLSSSHPIDTSLQFIV